MGACTSQNERGLVPVKTMQKNGTADDRLPKILLIGPGGSGKSTLFRKFRIDHGKGYDDADRKEVVPLVHNNILHAIKHLCEQTSVLNIEVVHPSSKQYIMELQNQFDLSHPQVRRHVAKLWRDEGIRRAYEQRFQFSQPLPPHAQYFLDMMETALQPAYLPSDEDIIRTNVRTTGIVEQTVQMGESKVLVMDVGGQRAERRKWVHCFKETTVLLYVADCSGYDEALLEDPDDNRLNEDFKLFQGICEMFPTKPVALVLSKADVLKKKLSRSNAAPLARTFPSYRGQNHYEPVLAWIKQSFLARNKSPDREVVAHVLNSVDEAQVRTTFTQIKEFVTTVRRD